MVEVFRDPRWFLNRFGAVPHEPLGIGPAEFIRVTENELRNLTFLDGRELNRPVEWRMSLEELSQQSEAARPDHPFGLIYHSAFCCSTWLARCLDATGIGQSLKEPYALTQMAFNRADETSAQFVAAGSRDRFLQSAVNVLSRPGESGRFPVLKTHNFCLTLAADIARLFPQRARAVFIYSDLNSFLISTLKSPERRQFVRLLLKLHSPAKAAAFEIPALDPATLNDGQAAAWCWLTHMAYYDLATRSGSTANVCSLDCERLLAQPVEVLLALAAFFGQPADRTRVETGLKDEAVTTHAKNSQRAFSPGLRRSELQTDGFRVRQEVRETLRWFESLGLREGLRSPPRLPLGTG